MYAVSTMMDLYLMIAPGVTVSHLDKWGNAGLDIPAFGAFASQVGRTPYQMGLHWQHQRSGSNPELKL